MEKSEIRLAEYFLLLPSLALWTPSLAVGWLQAVDRLDLSCKAAAPPLPTMLHLSVASVVLVAVGCVVVLHRSAVSVVGGMLENNNTESLVAMRVFYCGIGLAFVCGLSGVWVSVATLVVLIRCKMSWQYHLALVVIGIMHLLLFAVGGILSKFMLSLQADKIGVSDLPKIVEKERNLGVELLSLFRARGNIAMIAACYRRNYRESHVMWIWPDFLILGHILKSKAGPLLEIIRSRTKDLPDQNLLCGIPECEDHIQDDHRIIITPCCSRICHFDCFRSRAAVQTFSCDLCLTENSFVQFKNELENGQLFSSSKSEHAIVKAVNALSQKHRRLNNNDILFSDPDERVLDFYRELD